MAGYILTLDKQFLIQLCWQIFNTLILCGGLSYILYKPMTKFLDNRKERIKTQISTAENQLKEANALKAEYENKLKGISAERDEILESARVRATQREQQIIAEAKKEAEALKNRAELDIQREQEKVKDEVKNQIIEISSLMAGHFIKASIEESEQNKLINEVISDLGDVKWLS